MKSYRDLRGHPPDFQVRYAFRSAADGGRAAPPRQHLRFDFLYAGDSPQADGASMIWPEFLDQSGIVLPEGDVPLAGLADMYVVSAGRRPYHGARLSLATRGHFLEGARIVADCTVTRIIGLHDNPNV